MRAASERVGPGYIKRPLFWQCWLWKLKAFEIWAFNLSQLVSCLLQSFLLAEWIFLPQSLIEKKKTGKKLKSKGRHYHRSLSILSKRWNGEGDSKERIRAWESVNVSIVALEWKDFSKSFLALGGELKSLCSLSYINIGAYWTFLDCCTTRNGNRLFLQHLQSTAQFHARVLISCRRNMKPDAASFSDSLAASTPTRSSPAPSARGWSGRSSPRRPSARRRKARSGSRDWSTREPTPLPSPYTTWVSSSNTVVLNDLNRALKRPLLSGTDPWFGTVKIFLMSRSRFKRGAWHNLFGLIWICNGNSLSTSKFNIHSDWSFFAFEFGSCCVLSRNIRSSTSVLILGMERWIKNTRWAVACRVPGSMKKRIRNSKWTKNWLTRGVT